MSTTDFPSPLSAPGRRTFFTRVDWASFWTATLVSFAVYAFTAAPSVTLEDAGERATTSACRTPPATPSGRSAPSSSRAS